MKTTPHAVPLAALLSALLAACGGGGDGAGGTATVDEASAQAMSASSAVIPAEGGAATATLLATTQAVVAGGQASQTVACAGGGSAVFTVTGGSLASVGNGQLDAGEVYSVGYTDCRGSAGAASLSGRATLTVVSADAAGTVVDTRTQGLGVVLPQRTLRLNGASRLSRSVVVNGSDTLTTERWTADAIELTSQRGTRSSVFTLSALDLTRSVSVSNGVVTGRSGSGTHTLSAQWPSGQWSITTATQGTVQFDANGVPTQGDWTITLPNNAIGVHVVPGTLTVTLDRGPDGTIDRTWVFTSAAAGAAAG